MWVAGSGACCSRESAENLGKARFPHCTEECFIYYQANPPPLEQSDTSSFSTSYSGLESALTCDALDPVLSRPGNFDYSI